MACHEVQAAAPGCTCLQCAPGPPQAKTYTSFLDNIGITLHIIHSIALRSFFCIFVRLNNFKIWAINVRNIIEWPVNTFFSFVFLFSLYASLEASGGNFASSLSFNIFERLF